MAPRTKKPPIPEIESRKLHVAFSNTVDAIGSDVISAARECGERYPVVHRETVFDYIDMYGGEHKQEVLDWIHNFPGDFAALNRYLTKIGIPKTWA
jgi:hypothetical protein